jgi:hypothetical protein
LGQNVWANKETVGGVIRDYGPRKKYPSWLKNTRVAWTGGHAAAGIVLRQKPSKYPTDWQGKVIFQEKPRSTSPLGKEQQFFRKKALKT